MPNQLIIIAATAVLAGLLLMGVMLARRRPSEAATDRTDDLAGAGSAEATLRVVWWLTIAIVLLGVGISGSFATDQAPIFVVGAVAVGAVIVFHEAGWLNRRSAITRAVELVVATALVAALLALTGYAGSPFAMLFALVAVAAALAHGPRAGLAAAGLATLAFAGVLAVDPHLGSYGTDDVLRLSVGLVATWLLAFVAVAYAGHQRRALQGIIDVSRTDALTGLYNRSQLTVTLEQEVSRTRRSDRGFCVLMIDVDGLKAVNDERGHLHGDDVLRTLGGVISGSIRTVDSAYRFGGDEFVVLLPETDIVGAFFVAEKIRMGAEEVGLAMSGGSEPMTSVSIGLVSHPEDGTSADQLLAAADRAMYEAKKLGRNQISGNPRPRPALLTRRTPVAPEPAEPQPAEPVPAAAMPAEATTTNGGSSAEARSASVEVGPTTAAEVPIEIDDGEPEAHVVRQNIATATRAFDPDHQIRRAMDAFLSPSAGDRERPTPDH